jgi:hypothetical protein
MGDIYSSAERVIVWLGQPIPELDDVLWLIERYLPTVKDPRFAATSINDELLNFFQISSDEWLRLWESHRDFYKSYRWFSRAWIVQEFLLAREIIILCGEQNLDWEVLSLLSQQAIGHGPQVGINAVRFITLSSTRSNFPFTDGIPSQKMIDFMSSTLQCKMPEECWCAVIIHLVHTLWVQNSSCPHDKIYSIFEMAQKSQPSTLFQAPALRVDYEQTPEDAFLSFTAFLIKLLPTLAMLSYASGERRYNKANLDLLPSWCPDYTMIPKKIPVLTAKQAVASGLKPISASGDLTREGSPCQIVGRTLWVSGKRVAQVGRVCQPLGPVFARDSNTLFNPDGVQELLNTCLLLDNIYALTLQDRLEVLWRTILLDRCYLLGHP